MAILLLPKHPALRGLRKTPQGTSPEATTSSVIIIGRWLPGNWTNSCLNNDCSIITEWMFNTSYKITDFEYTFPSYGSYFSVTEITRHTYFLEAVSWCSLIKNLKSIYSEYPCSHLCRPCIQEMLIISPKAKDLISSFCKYQLSLFINLQQNLTFFFFL